jgi:hypothetical protein
MTDEGYYMISSKHFSVQAFVLTSDLVQRDASKSILIWHNTENTFLLSKISLMEQYNICKPLFHWIVIFLSNMYCRKPAGML